MPRVRARIVVALMVVSTVTTGLTGHAVAKDLDPIVAQVVELLEADVADELIVQWLESTGRRPGDVGSRDLIALTDAGATNELVSRLLDLVGRSPARPAEAPAREQILEGRVEVRIRLSSKQIWVAEDEPDAPRTEPSEVFLYVDGRYAARVRPSLQAKPVEVRRHLGPGRHEIRLFVETHSKLGKRWRHESLAVPVVIPLVAATGQPLDIEVSLIRYWEAGGRRAGGPLSYVVRQGDRLVAEERRVGGDPEEWPRVCEDIEASFAGGASLPRRLRSDMARCVRWSSLWSGEGAGSSREELLAWMAAHDYQPPLLEAVGD